MIWLWYLACLGLGAVAGSHSGFWGGIGVVILGVPAYFMMSRNIRTVVTESHMVAGMAVIFATAAAYHPLLTTLFADAGG